MITLALILMFVAVFQISLYKNFSRVLMSAQLLLMASLFVMLSTNSVQTEDLNSALAVWILLGSLFLVIGYGILIRLAIGDRKGHEKGQNLP